MMRFSLIIAINKLHSNYISNLKLIFFLSNFNLTIILTIFTMLSQLNFEDFNDDDEKTVAEWYYIKHKPEFISKHDFVYNRRIFRDFKGVTKKKDFIQYYDNICDTKIELYPNSFVDYIDVLENIKDNDIMIYISNIVINYLRLILLRTYNLKTIQSSKFFVKPLSELINRFKINWEYKDVKVDIDKFIELIKLSEKSEIIKCNKSLQKLTLEINECVINDDPTKNYYSDIISINDKIKKKSSKIIMIKNNHNKYQNNVQFN